MHRARGQEKHVAFARLEAIECLGHAVLDQRPFELGATDAGPRALADLATVREKHPTLALAVLPDPERARQGFIGMNLDAEAKASIDQLHHQGKLAAAKTRAHERRTRAVHKFTKGQAGQAPFANHAHAARMIGQLPCLADGPVGQSPAKRLHTPPSPHQGLIDWAKNQRNTNFHEFGSSR